MCFGLTDLSVYGRVLPRSDNVKFPNSEQIINTENAYPWPVVENEDSDYGVIGSSLSERTTRQVNRQRQRPQQFNNNWISTTEDEFVGIDSIDNQPSSANRPSNQSTSTTPNPNECLMACKMITTQQYNPVCGTDAKTYQNKQILNCLIDCGIRKYIPNYLMIIKIKKNTSSSFPSNPSYPSIYLGSATLILILHLTRQSLIIFT